MSSLVTTLRMLVRACGAVLIILGILFWTGHARSWISVHMLVGVVLTLALLVLAIVAARARVSLSLVVLAVVLAIGMPAVGVSQVHMMTGSGHWVIQVLHLAIGVAALWSGEQLAMRVQPSPSPRP